MLYRCGYHLETVCCNNSDFDKYSKMPFHDHHATLTFFPPRKTVCKHSYPHWFPRTVISWQNADKRQAETNNQVHIWPKHCSSICQQKYTRRQMQLTAVLVKFKGLKQDLSRLSLLNTLTWQKSQYCICPVILRALILRTSWWDTMSLPGWIVEVIRVQGFGFRV